MPVKVYCPNCSKELNSPDELVGQFVACPRCNQRFQVSGGLGSRPAGVGAQPVPPTAPPMTPPPPSGGASSSTANLERISLSPMPSAKPNVPNAPYPASPKPASQEGATPSGPRPARPIQPAKPPPPEPAAEKNTSPEPPAGTPPSALPSSSQQGARFKGPPAAQSPAAKQAKKSREVKKAKFVASGAVATRINLGEDGQLPKLVVADTKETTESENAEKSTSPLLMIAVLVFSVVVSVVMLLAPEGAEEAESTTVQESIEHIEQHYIGTGSEIEHYQRLLREGIQAERRGDQRAARSAFRQVLRMLRAETPGQMGLTAPNWANVEAAPNDRDLEKHLNVLLADD